MPELELIQIALPAIGGIIRFFSSKSKKDDFHCVINDKMSFDQFGDKNKTLILLDVTLYNKCDKSFSIIDLKLNQSERIFFLSDENSDGDRELWATENADDGYIHVDYDKHPSIARLGLLPITPYLQPGEAVRGIVPFMIDKSESEIVFTARTTKDHELLTGVISPSEEK